MQSSVPKRNTDKCLLTVGTDVKKNVMEGRGGEGRGGKEGRRGPGSVFMWISLNKAGHNVSETISFS